MFHRFSHGSEHLDVSFYGDGYVKIPIQDFSSQTDIRVRFRTALPDGLLLLAAGSFDYCSIALENGAVVVRLDLGSGEATLSSSPPRVKFDDLEWHSVRVARTQGDVTLTVDAMHVARSATPGSFFELNVDRFVFAGGTGNAGNRSVFFGNFPAFRGCMRDVAFNGVDVLGRARLRTDGGAATHAVTWDCSGEFDATSDRAMSFVDGAASFVAFPTRDVVPRPVTMTFDVRTRSSDALLVFNSGGDVDSDFFAAEIVRNQLKLVIGRGASVFTLSSGFVVGDGAWHGVAVVVDGTSVSVSVDGRQMERTEIAIARLIDVATHLYVGGVGSHARVIALHRRLESQTRSRASSSGGGLLVGCIRSFTINGASYGLREAVVTRSMLPDCVWKFPCGADPCADGTTCQEVGFDGYHCSCKTADCASASGRKTSDAPEEVHDVVRVRDLAVQEGKRSTLTTENIVVAAEYKDFGMTDADVTVRVVGRPRHGEIFVNAASSSPSSTIKFTVADLLHRRVAYIHDDSEDASDSVGLQAEFNVGNRDDVPEKFRKKYGATLLVRVVPVNDRPELSLPVNDGTLRVVANVPVRMTTKILNVSDADDDVFGLAYDVQYEHGIDEGCFELTDGAGSSPGGVRTKVTRFTHGDVLQGRVRYVHRGGGAEQRVRLQVSDGRDRSDAKTLHFIAVPLEISVASNTGVSTTRGAMTTITRHNLSAVTNAPHQDIELRYDVTEFPVEGKIQRQQPSSSTDNDQSSQASSFTQRHVDRNRVTYAHDGDSLATGDFFRFRVTALELESTREYEFHIRIVETKVTLVHCAGLRLKGTREGTIAADVLRAVSSVPSHGPGDVVYQMISTPTKGHVIRHERRSSSSAAAATQRPHKRKLSYGANFTQADVNDGRMSYKFQKALGSRIDDDFEFVLHIPGAESGVAVFPLTYEPVEGAVRFINNGLVDVIEGDRKMITPEDLFTEKPGVRNFRYTVTDGPHHGRLQLVDAATGSVTVPNVTTFSNDDIAERRVYYFHDDSETEEDAFSFTTAPIIDHPKLAIQEIAELSGTFEVRIVLRNDNAPRRDVDRTFSVVANRGRVVTPSDIWYVDPDVNYDVAKLEYQWINISNGEIVLAENRSVPVYRFTQKDIADGRLYFRHRGPLRSRSVVWVTDGYFYSTGSLEVEASEPFLRAAASNAPPPATVAERGGSVRLLAAHFDVETNLDADDNDVRFVVVVAPSHGAIKRNGHDRNAFSLSDVKDGRVVYEHDGSDVAVDDDFTFLVKIDEFQATGVVRLRVTASDGQQRHPPRVLNNRVAVVDELDRLILTSDLLAISHPTADVAAIRFTITNLPRYGRLTTVGSTEQVRSFTQADVNVGRLVYEHVSDAGQPSDVFQFDVETGSSSLTGLEFVIDVVPSALPLDVVANLTVDESGRVELTGDVFRVNNRHLQNEAIEFSITKEPANGRIENRDAPSVRISRFSIESVRNGKVAYVHDGSETTLDELGLVGKTVKGRGGGGGEGGRGGNKESSVKTIYVIVRPVNDKPPKVTNNKVLQVWTTGAATPITRDYLLAEDNDTSPDEIIYHLGRIINGQISTIGATSTSTSSPVSSFSQRDINEKRILFALGDAEKGSFEFSVTDGVARTEMSIFVVESNDLFLFVEVNRPLEVFPGLVQPITSAHLRATTTDSNHSHPIVFTVDGKPTRGRLVTPSVSGGMQEATSFFQEEIDSGTIFYEHTAATDEWSEEDSFSFCVETEFAETLIAQSFDVVVSYDNVNDDNRDALVALVGVEVDEGGRVAVTRTELDVSKLTTRLSENGVADFEVSFVVRATPRHGYVAVDGENATVGTQFTPDDVDDGAVVYVHDHSESLDDGFSFSVEIGSLTFRDGSVVVRPSSAPTSSVDALTLPVKVRPTNDQLFTLRTKSPSIELVQGSTKNITRAALLADDPDTDADGLRYVIITPPNNGRLVSRDRPHHLASAFTQRDVDDGRIFFAHDGSTDSGAFYFSVSDGTHKPLYKVFNISVRPLTLALVRVTPVELLQGQKSATLGARNLVVDYNGRRERLLYNVTKAPTHGALYLHDAVAAHFSQHDVDDGKLTYVQTDMSSPSDGFDFVVYDIQNVVRGRRLDVVVRANVKTGRTPFRASVGKATTITTEHLDAGDLYVMTGSDPIYYVILAPTRGKLSKAERTRRDVAPSTRKKGKNWDRKRKVEGEEEAEDEEEVSYIKNAVFNFTHDDVANERVSYRAAFDAGGGDSEERSVVVRDGFTFIVTANNAQPVPVTFDIRIVPPGTTGDDDNDFEDDDVPNDRSTTVVVTANEKATHDDGFHAGISVKDHLKIVFLVCAVILVLVVALLTFKCVRRRRRKRRQLAAVKEDSRSPLAAADPVSPLAPSPPPLPAADPVRARGGGANGQASSLIISSSPTTTTTTVPVINVTPDTPTSGRRRPPFGSTAATAGLGCDRQAVPPYLVGDLHFTEAVVEAPPASAPTRKTVVPPQTQIVVGGGREGREETGGGGGGKQDHAAAFDWQNVDPELLQHCRKTTPVLHKNQYWV